MAILVQDTFTDIDGTALASHTPDIDTVGLGWITGLGTPTTDIQSNQVRMTVDHTGHVIDAGQSNVSVALDWVVAAANLNRNGLFFRWQDSDNYWIVQFREDNGDILLIETVGGSPTTRDSSTYSFSEGATYEIKVVANGTSIEVFVNSVSTLSYTSSTFQTETHHGLRRYAGSSATRIDNFIVQDAAAGGVSGTLAVSLDSITAALSGVVEVTGTLSTALDSITVAASGTFTPSSYTGTLAVTLESISVAMSGTSSSTAVTGSMAATLADIQAAMSGIVEVTGTLSSTLDSIAAAFSGTVVNQASGTFNITLDGITFTATGSIGGWVIQAKDSTSWSEETKDATIWTIQ